VGARAPSGEPGRTARDRRRRRPSSHPSGATRRRRAAGDLRGRSPTPRHAVVPDAVGDAPARALGGDPRAQAPVAGAGRRRAPARVFPAPVTARGDRRLAWMLLAPALVVLAVVTGYPILLVVVLSLGRRVPIF